MKKLVVAILAACMLLSATAFAAESIPFVCPNGNEPCTTRGACLTDGTCVGGFVCPNGNEPCTTNGVCLTDGTCVGGFVCPNGNDTCTTNGACLTDGTCVNHSANSQRNTPRHGGGHGRGGHGRGGHGRGGHGRGHHGGARCR